MTEIVVLRELAEDARRRGDHAELMRLTELLLDLGDPGEPAGINAARLGALHVYQEHWSEALDYLLDAYKVADKGTDLHSLILNNLASVYVEMEAPHKALEYVDEFIAHLHAFPPEAQKHLGRVLQHKAGALEILAPPEAPFWYLEAAKVAQGSVRQLAIIDAAYAELVLGNKDAATRLYATADTTEMSRQELFAYYAMGAHLAHAYGDLNTAEELRLKALDHAGGIQAETVKRALMTLLGAEIALDGRDVDRAEALGKEAAGIFRKELRYREYRRAQDLLIKVVRARLVPSVFGE